MTDSILGFDQFARAAIETNRSSYNPLPAGSGDEYAAFFSRKNYDYLYAKARQLAKNEPDAGELYEGMMWAYSMVQPRGDEMDPRRELFGHDITASYVKELNARVLEKVVPEIKAANKLWDCYARNRNGPKDFQAEDNGYIDTRTRFQGSRVDMTYLLP
jgi:hypothetical protein